MNPQVPNSYKNFLPSRTFIKIIGIIAIVCILIISIPKIITWVKSHHSGILASTNIIATVPTGDPTTRDSDGDGVPDWEEIAVGLNPFSAETTPGVPDALAFEKIKSVVGVDNFQNAADNASDADKVGLALYSDISKNAISTGTTTSTSVSTVTGAEVANYIQAQQTKNKTYTKTDLTISDDSESSILAYYKGMTTFSNSPFDKDFITHITSYIQGKETKDVYLAAKLTTIDQMVTKLLAVPVPRTAVTIHLSILNSLYGLSQTLESYDSTTTDSLAQLGTVALAQDYIRTSVTSVANIVEYFSVAITPTSSKK